MNFKRELATLIKARNPIIWLQSFEEKRVERIVLEIANEQINPETKQPKKLIVWTATKGFEEVTGMTNDGRKVLNASAADLTTAFSLVAEDAKKSRNIYLFKDLHRYMGQADNMNYRLLRDVFEVVKDSISTVLILSPVLVYPKEVEKIITVLDVPFPNKEELKAVLDRVVDSIRAVNPEIKPPVNGVLEAVIRSGAGLTEDEFENIIAKSLVVHRSVDPKMVIAEKEQTIRKSGVIDFYQTMEGLGDIGGLENLKDWIVRRKNSFSEKAKAFGIRPPKGVFLAGVTGCGKSLTAKAMANEWQMPLLMVDASKVLGSYVGQSEQNLRQVFKTAEAVAPAILFIDEAEKMLPQGTSGDSGVSTRIFGMLLTWMQEQTPDKPVVVVMTANNPTLLPPELFNRFDATFFIDLPNAEERKAVWTVQIKKVKRDISKFDLDMLATKSEDWSGREMEMVVTEAMTIAFEKDEELSTEAILGVITKRTPLAVQRRADIDKMRDWGKGKAILATKKSESSISSGRTVEL